MSYLIHQVPGRIRMNTPILRRDETKAREVRELLDTRLGILSAKASPLTGSITVHYNPELISAQSILDSLFDSGILSEDSAPQSVISLVRPAFKTKGAVAGAVASFVLKAVLEYSVSSLIGRLV